MLNEVHKDVSQNNFLGQRNTSGPHYNFEVGDLELFQRKLENAESNGILFDYDFRTVENKWFDVLIGFLPLIILVGLWIFFMRRMSGGAGGGGSQIFSIGKSKAELFDKTTQQSTSFKDVAGLEGPKEEVKEKPKPKPKPKKPSKAATDAFKNLLEGDKSDGEPKGEGDDNKDGLKGKENGDPKSSKYYGNTGTDGDSNYNLAGRRALKKPIEKPDCEEEGTVVVSIEVDKNGRVIKAVPGVKGTTNSAKCLLDPAREAAMRTTWNAAADAPAKQKGTIIYKFTLTE